MPPPRDLTRSRARLLAWRLYARRCVAESNRRARLRLRRAGRLASAHRATVAEFNAAAAALVWPGAAELSDPRAVEGFLVAVFPSRPDAVFAAARGWVGEGEE